MPDLRIGAACLLLLAVGCDSAGPDLAPLDDILVVDVVDGEGLPTLRFVTEGTPGCQVPIAHRTRVTSQAVEVVVEGLEPPPLPCRALTPSGFIVALSSDHAWAGRDVEVRIEHRGETDVYRLQSTEAGHELVVIRTTTTRLGPR